MTRFLSDSYVPPKRNSKIQNFRCRGKFIRLSLPRLFYYFLSFVILIWPSEVRYILLKYLLQDKERSRMALWRVIIIHWCYIGPNNEIFKLIISRISKISFFIFQIKSYKVPIKNFETHKTGYIKWKYFMKIFP